MTFKQIEIFLAVADHRSFSKGGETVCLAQSTASQHIRALEEELGVRLFDRSAARVLLTEAGRLFYDYAARIFRDCVEATQAVKRFKGLEDATLRVGASTIPATCLIPDLLGNFSGAWPGIKLQLKQGDTLEVLRLLQDTQIELAVVGGTINDDRLVFEEMFTDRIILIAPAGTAVTSGNDPSFLANAGLVMREPGSGTRQAVEVALLRAGYDPRTIKITAQLGSSEAVRRAVLNGAGCGFISYLAVARELKSGILIELPLPNLTIERSFYLVHQKGISLSTAATTFMRYLLENATTDTIAYS